MNGLVFLEPVFLWALIGVAAVVGIHFLKRPKTVTLYFSTLRFFDKTTISSYKAEKIRKLLLLLIRITIFILIVLLFANPTCKRDNLHFLTNLQNELYITVDPTPSMSYKIGNVTLRDSALSLIDTILKLRGEEGVFVYDHNSNTFQKYKEQKNKIFSLKYYWDKKHFSQAIENITRNPKRTVLLVLSDFQEESTLFFESFFTNSLLKKIPIIFIPLTPSNPSNVTISDIDNHHIVENHLFVKVSLEGNKRYPLSLMAILEDIRTPTVKCTLSKDTTFLISSTAFNNIEWGSVIIETNDPLFFDNTYYFTNTRKKKNSILIIGEEKKNIPIGVALSSVEKNYWKTEYLPVEKITPQKWEEADLIIINNPNTITHKIIDSYRGSYKKKKAFLYAINCDSKDSLYFRELAERFSLKGNLIEQKENPLRVLLSDTLSTLWSGFPFIESKEVKIYTFFSELSGFPLLRLSNGKALGILHKDLFENIWFIIGTPIGITDCNNLCETGFYVPFLDRICRYLFKSIDSTEEKWIAGKEIKNPWYKKKNVQILTLDNKLISQVKDFLFKIEEPGIYKVIPEGEQPFLKAVVIDSSESKLIYRLPSLKNDKERLYIVKTPSEIVSYLKKRHFRNGILCLWLLLIIFIGLELYLRKNKNIEMLDNKK